MIDIVYVTVFIFVSFVFGMNYGEYSFKKYLTLKANDKHGSRAFKGYKKQWLYVNKEGDQWK